MNTKLLIQLVGVAVSLAMCLAIFVHPWIMFDGILWVGQIVTWMVSPHIEGERGSPTVPALIARYEEAHRQKDLKLMRPLLAWNRSHIIGDRSQFESAIMRICKQRLARVEFVRHPDFDSPRGGEATYYIPAAKRGQAKSHVKTGGVCGKLILVTPKGQRIDPAFLVTRIDGRFYLESDPNIASDVANSLDAATDPDWIGAPLGRGEEVLKTLK